MRRFMTLLGSVLLTFPAMAQTGGEPPVLPPTLGADGDLICALVLASSIGQEADPERKDILQSATDFYFGRLSGRALDSVALTAEAQKLKAVGNRLNLDAFRSPCVRRAAEPYRLIRNAMAEIAK